LKGLQSERPSEIEGLSPGIRDEGVKQAHTLLPLLLPDFTNSFHISL
jgi:hypothetical protein